MTTARSRSSAAPRAPQRAAGRAGPAVHRTAGAPGPAPLAASVLQLQRAYGNQAVQRLLPSMGVGTGVGTGSGPAVQRWHDQEHMESTVDGLAESGISSGLKVLVEHDKRYDTKDKISDRLADASVNMDRFIPQASPTKESHNLGRVGSGLAFGLSSAFSAIRNDVGNFFGSKSVPTTRGTIGEGADHGEAGKYLSSSPPGTSAPANKAREDYYINLSIGAFKANNVDLALNKLGDAAHVSADRGSHGEGDYGRGHDTPHPPPGKTGTQMPTYMQKFDDCDNKTLNPAGYAYGVEMTKQMFSRFFDKARGDLPEKFLALPSPETAVEGGAGSKD